MRAAVLILAAGLLTALAGGAPAAGIGPASVPAWAWRQPGAERDRIAADAQRQVEQALSRNDLSAAERILRHLIALQPDNFAAVYNLACVCARQGRLDEAGQLLLEAVRLGFVDLHHLRRDPDLEPLRPTPAYRDLLADWPGVIEAHLARNLDRARETFRTGRYHTLRDEPLRIVMVSAMDPTSTQQALEELRRLHRWALTHVFPVVPEADAWRDDPWVVVVLPTPRDFRAWAVEAYGLDAVEGVSGIGGHYSHDDRRLVAMDLGPTLRHEFFHVLHWRHVSHLGQSHPVWVQEGLCSLIEEYHLDTSTDPPTLRPVPSWRTNIAQRNARGGRLLPLATLARLSRERFTGTNPLAHYAQARTVFLFLHDRGVLRQWYESYTRDYARDASGLGALESVFGQPLAQIEREYRQFARSLPLVPEPDRPGPVSLGLDVDAGAGDGPVIVAIPALIGGRSNPTRNSGLRVGDVITAIHDQPTRDLHELVRVLGTLHPGQTVRVSFRRGSRHDTVTLTVQAR